MTSRHYLYDLNLPRFIQCLTSMKTQNFLFSVLPVWASKTFVGLTQQENSVLLQIVYKLVHLLTACDVELVFCLTNIIFPAEEKHDRSSDINGALSSVVDRPTGSKLWLVLYPNTQMLLTIYLSFLPKIVCLLQK